MSTIELKKQLIEKIESIEDDIVLEEIYRILDLGEDKFEVYLLSEKQKSAIEIGLDDIKNDKVTPHEDSKKEIDSWLSE